MASSQELWQLFTEGKLVELLASTFGGESRRLDDVKDSDFIMSFGGVEQTPNAQQVAEAVKMYYIGLGYKVDDRRSGGGKCFEAFVHHDRHLPGGCVVSVVITIPYPLDGNRANLRATCEKFR
jgi:hypothetical protein